MILSPATIYAGTRTLLWARTEKLSAERTAVAVFDAMARAILPTPDAAVAVEDFFEWGRESARKPYGKERSVPCPGPGPSGGE